MASTLMDQHTEIVGLEFRSGRVEAAPSLKNIELYTEVCGDKAVRFDPMVSVRHIASEGKALKVCRSARAIWRASGSAMSTARGRSGT